MAVSPIVGGRALKGPADRMLVELGHEATVVGVARLYRDDRGDARDRPGRRRPGRRRAGRGRWTSAVTPSVMSTPADRGRPRPGDARGDRPRPATSDVSAPADSPGTERPASGSQSVGGLRVAVEAVGQAGPRGPAEVDAGPHRRQAEAGQLVGTGGDERRRRAALGDRRRQVTQRRLLPGADVHHETRAPRPGADQGVDDVVDEDEVARLTPVAGEPGRLAADGRVEQRRHDAPPGVLSRAVHARRRRAR